MGLTLVYPTPLAGWWLTVQAEPRDLLVGLSWRTTGHIAGSLLEVRLSPLPGVQLLGQRVLLPRPSVPRQRIPIDQPAITEETP